MDTAWLQDFMVLADTGSFTRAAAMRNISQAAFSRRIQALENWVGAKLVDRSTYPIRLTAEGERFHADMAETLHRLIDIRTDLSRPTYYRKGQVRIAMPHVLAGSRFPRWWQGWSEQTGMLAVMMIANVNNIVADFVAGAADILICHHGRELPIVLGPNLFVRCTIENDRLRPYRSRHLEKSGSFDFPGSETLPVPLLMYSKGAYFARLVDMIVEQAPSKLFADLRVEASMAEVLRDCVATGLGVGWLPDCAIHGENAHLLTAITDDRWSMDLEIVAFAHRTPRSAAVGQLWAHIEKGAIVS